MNLSGVYRAVAKVAGDVLQGAGTSGTYVEQGEPTFNPETGQVEASEALHPVSVLFEEIGAHLIDGSNIQVGDRWALLPAKGLSAQPSTSGALRVDGMDWQVVRAEPLRPGNTTIYYRLQVRR